MSRRYRDPEFLRQEYVTRRKSTAEIATMCDVSASTVSRWLDRHDIDRDPLYRDFDWLSEQYVGRRRDQRDIAEECGVAETTICHWLARLGVTDGQSLVSGTCKTCGDQSRYYPSVRDGQFRSNECANDPRKRQVELTCPACDETFHRRQSLDTEYCSMSCWSSEHGLDVDSLYVGGWQAQREQALQRDVYQCTVCGISNSDHKDRFGFGLDVHHIVPVRLFVQWDEPVSDAHSLRNLTTRCRTHHPDAPGETVQTE